MVFEKRKKIIKIASILTCIVTVIAFVCAMLAVFTRFRLVFAAGAAASSAACMVILPMALLLIKRETDVHIARIKVLTDMAFITFDKKSRRTFFSDNFEELTGVSVGSGEVDEEKFREIMDELKKDPAEPEKNIYATPIPERWLRLLEYSTDSYDGICLKDASDYMICKNVVKSLKYYDSATGILSRDAFIHKLDNASAANSGSDTLGIIHVVLSGMDKVMSFSGTAAVDNIIKKIGAYIKKYENPHNIFAGRTATNEFSVLITETYDDGCRKLADKVSEGIQEVLAPIKSDEKIDVKAYCGYACFHGNENEAGNMLSCADFAAFDAEQRGINAPVLFDPTSFDKKSNEFRKAQVFNSVVAGYRVDYHFQPVVNARTGAVFAYEALMRPRAVDGIKLTPLEMLDIAEQQEMLYEIERITFQSTLRHLSENQDKFGSRKLFINCIPSTVLSDDDYTTLIDSYGSLFNKVVIEITEGTPVLSNVVDAINSRYRSHRAQVALDDYGTGYSNDSTLLSVKPDYIKIDHTIINGIYKDPQKQHLVSNMVDFCGQHGITVIAEGVETEEELESVISLGVDLIQGYYTGRATAVLIRDIPAEIQNQIINFNLKHNGNVSKTFEVTTPEPVNIVDLALSGYTDIVLRCGLARIEGSPDVPVKINILSETGKHSKICLTDVNIECSENPAITLAKGEDVNLELSGRNTISRGSIRVPQGAALYICGEGSLDISCNKAICCGIGGTNVQDHGSIKLASEGKIRITANGDTIVGIGGGIGSEDSLLDIISGTVELQLNGKEIVGIGSFVDESVINLNNAKLDLALAGQSVVGAGSKSGHTVINSVAGIEANISGDNCCGLGTLDRGSSNITVNGGKSNITVRGKNIAAIGSINGTTEVILNSGVQNLLCEGDNATCIGDSFGSGTIKCRGSAIKAVAKASNENTVGVKEGKVYVTGGSIYTSDPSPIECYSINENKLVRVRRDGHTGFNLTMEQSGTKYIFNAEPIEDEHMYVYVPEEYAEEASK